MTTGRINQVTDRRSLCHGRIMPGLGTLHHAHRSRLWSRRRPSGPTREGHCPTGLQTSMPHRRQDTTNDFSLEHNTQERHTRRVTCDEHLPFPASTARIPTTQTVITAFSPATNPFLQPVSLSPDGDTVIRAVGPKGSICTGVLPRPWIREDLRRAHREGRDDRCSFPHDLPGITAKLLSLTLWRNFPQQTPLERTLPRNLCEASAARTVLRVSGLFRDKCR